MFFTLTLIFTSFSNMSRKMQLFHQLDSRNILADFYRDRLYIALANTLCCQQTNSLIPPSTCPALCQDSLAVIMDAV